LEPESQKEIIEKINFIKFTDKTIVDPKTLAAELELTRKRGYAVDNMEHEVGVRCIAAPIWDSTDKVVASLSISGPSIRLTETKIPELSQLIMAISQELGTNNFS
jgi:IclR family KDG regulon transcriptional repressor